MLFLFSLIPATVFVVVGYFVLYASTRAEGGIKQFGKYLGAWIFLLAGLSVLGGVYGSAVGARGPMGGMLGDHMETMGNVEEQQLEMLRQMQGN